MVVIACGALGGPIREITARRGWPIELHCLPALLHNRPAAITPEVERLAMAAQARGLPVAIGYADCGTYGALDELSARLGLRRLPGLHCYDLLAGPDRVAALFEAEPGTYVLTDFLVRSFRRTVLAGLGLDRYPELWPDYFGHYRRVVWLAQSRDPALEAEAQAVAARFGLPLTVIDTGTTRLERELEHLLTASPHATGPGPAHGAPAGPPHPRARTRESRPTRRRGLAAPDPAPVPSHPPCGLTRTAPPRPTCRCAASPPSPLPPPAPPIPAGVAGGVVIRRSVLLWEHQSSDHESKPTAATDPGDPTGHSSPASPRKSGRRGGAVRGGLMSAAALLAQPRYEVFPTGSVEQAVADWVPPGMTVTVTASPAQGSGRHAGPDRAAGGAGVPGGAAPVRAAGHRRRAPGRDRGPAARLRGG